MTGVIDRIKGFTLIELLVVLAIVASIGALIAPDLWKTYQKAVERQTLIALGAEISVLRRQLQLESSSLTIASNELNTGMYNSEFPVIPNDWLVTGNTELFFLPSGLTSGGTINLEAPSGRNWSLVLHPLDGKVTAVAL